MPDERRIDLKPATSVTQEPSVRECTKCHKPVNPVWGWDFVDYFLCQECWEDYTSQTWWAVVCEEPGPSLEDFHAAR
jgi:hypothetical protein